MAELEKISEEMTEPSKPSRDGVSIRGVRFSWVFLLLASVAFIALSIASLSVWSVLQHRDRLVADNTRLGEKNKSLTAESREIEDAYKSKEKKQAELDRLKRGLKKTEQEVR